MEIIKRKWRKHFTVRKTFNMESSMHSSPLEDYNRETVDSWLSIISEAIGKELRLNPSGICAFIYDHLTIVIEVPEKIQSFFVYTTIAGFSGLSPRQESVIIDRCLRSNYLGQETRGGKFTLNPENEIEFWYTDRTMECNEVDFRNILENTIDTALKLQDMLQAVKNQYEPPVQMSTFVRYVFNKLY